MLSDVRHVEWRQHRVFLDPHEGVANLEVAACSVFADLNFAPKAVVFVIRKYKVSASRACRNHVARLCVGDEIKSERHGPALAMFQLQASQHVDEVVS